MDNSPRALLSHYAKGVPNTRVHAVRGVASEHGPLEEGDAAFVGRMCCISMGGGMCEEKNLRRGSAVHSGSTVKR